MRVWWWLAWGAVAALLWAGCSGGSGGQYYTTNPHGTGGYGLPAQFGQTQGSNGWYFMSTAANNQAFQPLGWGTAPVGTPYGITSCWLSELAPEVLITKDRLRPGPAHDAVVAFRVPKSGMVTIAWTMQGIAGFDTGDGVNVSILQGSNYIAEPAYLPNSPQSQTMSAIRTLNTGDMIYLRVNAGTTAEGDWYKYSVDVSIK